MFELKLPKVINEINYFKRNENGKGCVLYSYTRDKGIMTICKNDFADIEKDFSVSQNTLEIIKNIDVVNLEITENKILFEGKGGNNFTANLLACEGLPTFNDTFENEIEIEMNTLIKAKTFSNSDNVSFAVLNGVKINNFGDVFATDRITAFRKINDSVQSREGEEKYIVLPKEFIDILKSEIGTQGKVKVKFNKTKCLVEKEDMSFVSGLYDGKYPELNMIFAPSYSSVCSFSIKVNGLKAKAKIFDKIKTNENKLVFCEFKNDKLTIEGESLFETELEMTSKNDNDYDFSISYDNFKKMLVVAENIVAVDYYGEKRPIRFGLEDKSEIVLLPIVRI